MKFAQQACRSHCSVQASTDKQNKWAVIPSQNIFVFPESTNPEIAAYGKETAGTAKDQTSTLKERGVIKGVPLSTMVGPSLRLAHQLEAIV